MIINLLSGKCKAAVGWHKFKILVTRQEVIDT